eukprot:14653360-Alexandrium_andersonii.AAC.1
MPSLLKLKSGPDCTWTRLRPQQAQQATRPCPGRWSGKLRNSEISVRAARTHAHMRVHTSDKARTDANEH